MTEQAHPESADNSHPIFEAIADDDFDRVREFVLANASALQATRGSGATPLHVAVHERKHGMVQLLLALGAPTSVQTDWGGTPLTSALLWGDRKLVDMLIDVGGVTPCDLPTAAGAGDQRMVESFFDEQGQLVPNAGAPVSCQTEEGRWVKQPPPDDPSAVLDQALHLAARNGQRAIASLLVERGANVSAPGFFGALPQHWAAGCNQREMVEWLFEQGADPAARDPKFDATAAGWAREFGHDDLAAHLEPICDR